MALAVVLFAAMVAAAVYLQGPAEREEIDLNGVVEAGNPDYEWYQKYVDLRDAKIKMGLNFAGKRMVIFSGIIENNGERALDVVQVDLSFFNYEKLVWKTMRTPIIPGSGGHTPPVEPLEQRGFTLYMENIPEGWLASHAEMAIHGFRFLARP